MKVDNVLDNVANFLIHPYNNRNNCTQATAWIVTIFVGIATVGIVHGLSFLWLKLRVIPKQPKHEKIQKVFHERHPITPTSNKPSTKDSSSVTVSPTQKSSETTTPTLPFDKPEEKEKLLENPSPTTTTTEASPKELDSSSALLKEPTQSTSPINKKSEEDKQPIQPADKNLEKDKAKTSKPVTESSKVDLNEFLKTLKGLLPTEDMPCKLSCPADWKLFRLLVNNYQYRPLVYDLDSLGQFKVHSSYGTILVDKLNSNNSYQPFLEIEVNNDGTLSKIDAKNPSAIQEANVTPQQCLNILDSCFRETLKFSSSFAIPPMTQYYGQLNITLPQRSISKNPEYQLKQIYDSFVNIKSQAQTFSIKVTLQDDSLRNQDVIDAGGPRKQYMETLAKSLISSPELKFFTCRKTGLVMPCAKNSPANNPTIFSSLSTKEDELFLQLGYLIGFFHMNSEEIRSGKLFIDFLFRAIQVFKDKDLQVPFSRLDETEQLRLAKEIVEAKNKIEMEKIPGYTPSQYAQLQVAKSIEQLILEEKMQPRTKKDLRTIQKNLEQANVQFLEDMPEKYVEDGEIKYDIVNDNKKDFLKALYSCIFNYNDNALGKISEQMAAIHSMARGMRDFFVTTYNFRTAANFDWATVHELKYTDLETRIQGVFDREIIANSIVIEDNQSYYGPPAPPPTPYFVEKKEWLQDWVRDKDTTDDELRLFLQMVTGQTVLEKRARIKIRKSQSDGLLTIHTCSSVIDIYPEATADGAFNTKEGFYQYLKNEIKPKQMNFNQS